MEITNEVTSNNSTGKGFKKKASSDSIQEETPKKRAKVCNEELDCTQPDSFKKSLLGELQSNKATTSASTPKSTRGRKPKKISVSDSQPDADSQTPKKRSNKSDEEHKCTECDFTTEKRLLFKKHCLVNHADKYNSEQLLSQFKCDFCEKVFKDPIQLTNHKNLHIGIKPYKCVECEDTFTTRGELIRHTRYKHTLERPHKCTLCDYSSVELSKLKRHIRVHTDERPYLCPYCDYAGRDTFKLKRHLRVHTGEKPYECPTCRTCFSQSNSLKVHMNSSHIEGSRIQKKNARKEEKNESPDTSIENNSSKKLLSSVSVPQQEASDSSPPAAKTFSYYQSVDDSYYSNEHYLKKESSTPATFVLTDVVMDSDQGIFTCTECSMKFTTVELLNEHFIKHTGERPFECEICNMKFGHKFALRSHKLSHDITYVENLKTKLKSYNESTVSIDLIIDSLTVKDSEVPEDGSEKNKGSEEAIKNEAAIGKESQVNTLAS